MHCPRGSPKVESSMPRVERIGLAAQITSGRIRKNACSGARELRSPPAGEFSASRLAALFVQAAAGGIDSGAETGLVAAASPDDAALAGGLLFCCNHVCIRFREDCGTSRKR